LEFAKLLDQIAERLGHYASLKSAEDSSNNDHLSRQAELTNLLTKVGEVASFINPEIQQISDETLQRFWMTRRVCSPAESGLFRDGIESFSTISIPTNPKTIAGSRAIPMSTFNLPQPILRGLTRSNASLAF
jgi:hypothetical protein